MYIILYIFFFFFSSRRRHTRYIGDWSSDVCSSDLFQSRNPRTGDGGFETRGLRDDKVRGHASVGPATDAEFLGIGDALRDGVVHHSHVVLKILVAPVGKNGFAEFLAVAGRASRIGKKDGVAVGGVELGEVVEGSGVLADRAAVRI